MLTWTSARFPDGEQSCRRHFPKAPYRIVIPPATSHVVNLRWVASTSNDVAGCNAYRGHDGAGRKSTTALVAWAY